MAAAGVQSAYMAGPDQGLGISLDTASVAATETSSLFDPDTYSSSEAEEAPRLAVPCHPIPAMQDAFAESLIEATQDPDSQAILEKPKLRNGDANTRRQHLLDQSRTSGPPAAQWRYRPGQHTHELKKLMAQISFGVYLLLNGMANSNESAVTILQGHIDEVDEFLETTMEDIALATVEITERIDYLTVPMSNVEHFEKMLEDRDFRLQIVEGNENIEHVLARTSTALTQSVDDIKEGLQATRDFTGYLAEQQAGAWRKIRPDVIDIFDAMAGNTEGWLKAFEDLQVKETTLSALLLKLASIVSEIDRRAGEVSRRTRVSRPLRSQGLSDGAETSFQFSVQPFSAPTHSRSSSGTSSTSSQKTPRASPAPSQRTRSPPPRLSLGFRADRRLTLGLGSALGAGLTDTSFFEATTPTETGTAALASPTRAKFVHLSRSSSVLKSEESSGNTEETQPINAADTNASGAESSAEPAAEPASDSLVAAEAGLQAIIEDEDELNRPETIIIAPEPSIETGDIFILEPRTYSPLPPAPEPSPTVFEKQPNLASSPLLGGRPFVHAPTRSDGTLDSSRRVTVVRIDSNSDRPSSTPLTKLTNIASSDALDGAPDSPPKELPQKKSSLRQRVSLKRDPPESILVPPPSMPGAQRPIYSSPRFRSPDSAYGSDMDRSNVRSAREGLSPPPRVRPQLIPSPHSDQQYFRPVQASPHSPLQQRPHTAGGVRQSAYQHHQRNAPSRLGGMSTLSNMTSATPDTPGSRTLKKKKSAFGWFKKAFSLDEEERAAFEQRKKDQARNPYYDPRSTVFLDGKRVR
jgi:hypothetical protein